MDLPKNYNPYDFANPVMVSDLLVGREKEMNEIKYYLDNAKTAPRPINIALLGERASGKTSILNITELEAKERGFCVARINFDEDDVKTQLIFFSKLFDSVLTSACESGAFGGIDGKTYDTYLDAINAYTTPDDKTFCPFLFSIQYAKAMSKGNMNAQISDQNFRRDLIVIQKELMQPLALLFDEGNVLAKSRAFLQKLRNIFMSTPGFMLIMTGTPDLFPVMDDVFSPIVRQFKKITVSAFTRVDDTRACIRKPLEKLGIVPEQIFDFETYRDVGDIHDLSGGRPYEIQLICHMLFRRIELKRAEKMKLDFSVLEDVRSELETYQDVTSRPILRRIRNLSKKQLIALSILCSCEGHATFDQVWALEFIFNTELSWTKDKLKDELEMYVNEGVLNIKNELISFAGDDFDKIYAKYYAREQEVTLNFSPYPLEVRWLNKLSDFINSQSKNRSYYQFPSFVNILDIFDIAHTMALLDSSIFINLQSKNRSYYQFPSFDGMLNIFDTAHTMALLDSNEDVFVDSDPLSEIIYRLMEQYQGQPTLPIIAINPHLPWLNSQSLYYHLPGPADSELLGESVELTSALVERISKLGGNLVIERREIQVIPLEILSEKVERTANKRCRTSLARYHAMKTYSMYTKDKNREDALLHANLS